MGSTARHVTSIAGDRRRRGIVGAGTGRCSGGDDDDSPVSAGRPGATGTAGARWRRRRTAPRTPRTAAPTRPRPAAAPTLQVPGQAIAIEARATLEADDVRAAVDRVTTTVTDPRRAASPPPTSTTAAGHRRRRDQRRRSRATLVAGGAAGRAAGHRRLPSRTSARCTSFDQLAEDVTDQLADLDVRIANMRASVERVRALYAEAVDIDSDRAPRGRADQPRDRARAAARRRSRRSTTASRCRRSTRRHDAGRRGGRRRRRRSARDRRRRCAPGGARSSAGCSPSCSSSPPIAPFVIAALVLALARALAPPARPPPRARHRRRHGSPRRRRAASRQPSGVSTQSATVPSGKANGARSPVWAYASGSDERAERGAPAVPAPGRRLGQLQRPAGQLDDAVDDAVLLVAVADRQPTGGAGGVPLEVEGDALGVPYARPSASAGSSSAAA